MGERFRAMPAGGRGGALALFLNAGDPPLPVLADVVRMLDDEGLDCLELAVPFPNSVTDGPVVRRSASRALAGNVGLDDVLRFIGGIAHELRRLRIVLLADWAHSVRPRPLADFLRPVADAGVDGLLVHALPPRLRPEYYLAAEQCSLPVVTTCYPGSAREVLADAATHATAYVYLVAHYGRSGQAPPSGYAGLAPTIATLRTTAPVPIAVGFGIRTRDHVAMVHRLGADMAIVGSAGVAEVERAVTEAGDVVDVLAGFVRRLRTQEPLSRSVSGACP